MAQESYRAPRPYSSGSQGCLHCKDGYYKSEDGRNCDKCHSSCKTCFNKNTCLTCSDDYYLLLDSTYQLCKPFNESIGCINITQPLFPGHI